MKEENEKFDLINYKLSRNSLQRSLSLNDEDLTRIRYCDNHIATTSTSLSTTASIPQNSLQSTSLIRGSTTESLPCHPQNGRNG
ncbi:unnamed protein product [Cercopithifilaria johnstoni]|uniref:Uncharacterized protein n=1 Tax=Cercopithifilaria johnstoni TaxID=2874296 RepID=A0A8J2LZ20_9BILA|nr:unnamed protein product [Cercopithifilaria johnstoni]